MTDCGSFRSALDNDDNEYDGEGDDVSENRSVSSETDVSPSELSSGRDNRGRRLRRQRDRDRDLDAVRLLLLR